MDKFVENTGGGSCADKTIVMDYYDGNTLTALWNLAQHFAISDQHFGSTFGPSTIGAINIVSGNTHGVQPVGAGENGTMIANSQPAARRLLDQQGRGPGDVQRPQHRRPDERRPASRGAGSRAASGRRRGTANGDAVCAGAGNERRGREGQRLPPAPRAVPVLRLDRQPAPRAAVLGGRDRLRPTQANHQYDLKDFDAALAAGNLPQVSFLKAISAEDAHPGYSGPLDEQHFVVRVLNELQQSPEWASTAVFLAYDDSDGWYDHAFIAAAAGLARSQRRAQRRRPVRARARPGRLRRPLRAGPAPAAARRLALGEAELRRLHPDRADVDHPVHRGQLEPRADRRPVVRRACRGAEQHVRLRPRARPRAEALPRRRHRAAAGRRAGTRGDRAGAARPRPTAGRYAHRDGDGDGARRPIPTATATATATPVPTATPKPTPVPKPKVAVKLSCKTTGGGKRITVSCTASGKDATRRTTLRLAILKGKKELASARVSLQEQEGEGDRPSEQEAQGRALHAADHSHPGGPRRHRREPDDAAEVGVRRALLAAVLCLAGCGGTQRAPAVAPAPPAAPRRGSGAPTCRPRRSPTRRPASRSTATCGRSSCRCRSRHSRARSPATGTTARGRRRRWQVHALALRRALRAGDRAGARRAWAGAYERYLRLGAAYGALGDLDAAIVADRERLERGLWTGEPLSALRPAASAPRGRRARAAPGRAEGRDHAAGLRDPRARDPRGRPARHAQRRRRALQRRGRARHRRRRWPPPRPSSARCARCWPRAACWRRSRPGC